MKIVKGIIKYTIFIILLVLLVFNIYNFISRKILKKDLPTVFGYAVLEVVSGSMEPTINIGDLIIIKKNINNLKEGEIVTFYDVNGSFVTHRIIEINEDSIITQGDANNTVDEAINKDKIVGKYIRKIDKLGILFKSLKNPIVMVLILVIGIIICLLVSTDKKLIPLDISDEEKEYIEYKEKKKKDR